jgi:valyl-tRNA synthetase
MSKSKNNVIDPLEFTKKYGTDALRIALVIGNTPGTSLALAEDRIRGYRNFSTKVWNIGRFILMNRTEMSFDKEKMTTEHKKLLDDIFILKRQVENYIDPMEGFDFEFHLAAEKIYHYIWHTLADKIIEEEKPKLQNGTATEKAESYALLEYLLLESLKMLHPFMPFITEEIYQIFRPGTMLMVEEW